MPKKAPKSAPPARNRGFTLIEMMVAMTICTFGLLTIMGLFAATLLMAQRTETDLVTDIAYSDAVHATDATGFNAVLLGNAAPPLPILNGDEYSFANEPAGVIRQSSPDYAVAVNFGAIGVTQWFTQRYARDPAAAPPTPPAVLLPGEKGLQYITIHTGHIDQRGLYNGWPNQGETLNDFVLIGAVTDSAND